MAEIKKKSTNIAFNLLLWISVAILLVFVFSKSGNPFAVLLVGTVIFVLIKIFKKRC